MRALRFCRWLLPLVLFAPALAAAQTQTATPWCIRQRVLLYNAAGFVSQTPEVARDSGSYGNGLDGASGRRGLISYRGGYYHAFYDNSAGSTDIYFRRSPDGVTWSPKVRISVDSSVVSDQFWPVLVAWGGGATPVKLAVVYHDNRQPGQREVWLTRSLNGGQTWAPARRLHGALPEESSADLAVSPEDSLYLSVSVAQSSSWQGMRFTSSANGGQTWRPWRTVYSVGPQFTRLATLETGPGGHLWMGTSEDQSFHKNARIVHSADYGRTWDGGTNATSYVASGDIIYENPAALSLRRLPNGNLLAFYHFWSAAGPPYRLGQFTARSTDNGATWAAPVQVDDAVPTKGQTSNLMYIASGTLAVSPGGALYAAYADDRRHSSGPNHPLDSLEYDVYLTRSLDNGQTWSAGRRVNVRQGLHRHGFPALAVKRRGTTDSVLVTWQNMRFVPPPTGLADDSRRVPLRVWPNPATGRAYLAWPANAPGARPTEAVLLDGLGRVVRRQLLAAPGTGTSATTELSLTGLAPGLYSVRVGARVARLVVEQ